MDDLQCCCEHHLSTAVSQTLDEMEFVKGLWSAAVNGETNRVQQLLREGKDSNKRDSSGYTALHYASRNGHMDVCAILISNGACVNAQTRTGLVTPLHRAAYCAHPSVIRLLLKHKADPSLLDDDGKNVLHKACEKGSKEVVTLLVEADTQLSKIKDKRGLFPKDYTSDLDIVKLLGD